MAFFFNDYPLLSYSVKNDGNNNILTNVMVRFKIIEAFQRQEAVYYTYIIKEGERPDQIAFKYYNDASLDWVIFIVNNIIDIDYDWPLDRASFEKYIEGKYKDPDNPALSGVERAIAGIHHYEKILNRQTRNADGSVIPERYVEIDEDTYNKEKEKEEEDNSDYRVVYCYEYEIRENDKKREIKLLSRDFIAPLISQVKQVFRT